MSIQEARLIYNPHAGMREWKHALTEFQAYWQAIGWKVKLQPTDHGGHAIDLAAQAAREGCALVFAAGGDGTLNEVANGLAGSESVMAPLPVGTANSFAKELQLPVRTLLDDNRLLTISAALEKGRIQRMDLGLTEDGRYWLLWASTGADGFVIEHIEPRTRLFKRLGIVGYAAKVLFFLPSFRGIQGRVIVDDQEVHGQFLMVNVSNCTRYAGGDFVLNKDGVLDDGFFEVWIFHGRRWPMLFAYTLEVGLETYDSNPNIDVIKGRSVRIDTSAPAAYHLDAEPAGRTPLQATIAHQALRVLVPDVTPRHLFQEPGLPLRSLRTG